MLVEGVADEFDAVAVHEDAHVAKIDEVAMLAQ